MKPSQKTVKCIDWSRLILDLRGAGLSFREIAAGCGYKEFSRSDIDDGGKRWVQRLQNLPNTQPDFHSGALLIGLWALHMQKPLADLPRADFLYIRNAHGRIYQLPLVDAPAGQPAAVEPMPSEP